jgi:hypothetical protein
MPDRYIRVLAQAEGPTAGPARLTANATCASRTGICSPPRYGCRSATETAK